MKYAVIGFGGRGNCYTKYFVQDKRAELAAVCDKKQDRLDYAIETYGAKRETCYLSDKEFFSKGKLADILIVSTQDADHYGHAMEALKVGYDLLLEKPIADSLERCLDIYNTAKKLGRKVFVCHVLRYAPFFTFIKNEVASGKYGAISTLNMTENVMYWHQAHSYVRGNWAVVEKCTPMLLAKCCHDLDIITWLFADDLCKSVTSFGSLDYFKRENAPEGSADRCYECKYAGECPYDAFRIYTDHPSWLHNVNWYFGDYEDREAIKKAVSNPECPYNRCVWKCENTAVDHQVVNMLFASGSTAHLTMTAFSQRGGRDIHLHCTKGEIYGRESDTAVTCTIYGKEPEVVDIGKFSDGLNYGHGGGDSRLVSDIIEVYEHGTPKGLTSIENSFMSHNIGYAAEKSRLAGGIPQPVEKLI